MMLVGCGTTGPSVRPIDVTQKVEPIEILHPPLPEQITWEKVEWQTLTPEKLRELLAMYEAGELTERDLVFVALTPEGYERLALNMAELRRYLEGQKSVIKYYRETVPKEIMIPKEDGDEINTPTE